MRAHDWFTEHLPDYVSRALEPGDEALFRDHLNRCADCREAVARLKSDLSWLPMGVTPVPPRPGFSRRVVDAVTHPPRKRIIWAWPALTAASFLVAVGVWRNGRARITELEALIDQRTVALAAARDTLSVALGPDRVVQATIELEGRHGGMLILADEASHRWKVIVHGIPRAKQGERYTFWFITGDGMVHGAEVDCDENTPAVLLLDMPPGAPIIRGGALTIELKDADPSIPRGRELAHLEL
ncbi:MAG TPA: zf-HC2 domain-containing protein [Gemmatimonadales bacterium]